MRLSVLTAEGSPPIDRQSAVSPPRRGGTRCQPIPSGGPHRASRGHGEVVGPALVGIARLASWTGQGRTRRSPEGISAAPGMELWSRPFILGGRRDPDSWIRVVDRMPGPPMGLTDRRQSHHNPVRRIAMNEMKTQVDSVTPLPWKVISGGQTGADQSGLIVARRFGIPTGGWMPHGWKTATGPNPQLAEEFGLREHTGDYADRTAANVRDSQGTIRFAASFQSLGERCTLKWINNYGRPHIDVDIRAPRPVAEVVEWMRKNNIRVLNVAGNVQPKSAKALSHGITASVIEYLSQVFCRLGHCDVTAGNVQLDANLI